MLPRPKPPLVARLPRPCLPQSQSSLLSSPSLSSGWITARRWKRSSAASTSQRMSRTSQRPKSASTLCSRWPQTSPAPLPRPRCHLLADTTCLVEVTMEDVVVGLSFIRIFFLHHAGYFFLSFLIYTYIYIHIYIGRQFASWEDAELTGKGIPWDVPRVTVSHKWATSITDC